MTMFKKHIIFLMEEAIIACDGNCAKAFGLNGRARAGDQFLADDEVGIAPVAPGTWEGRDTKPLDAKSGDDMNKWCARECERCALTEPFEKIALPDWSQRR